MKISVLTTCSFVAMSFLVPVSLGPLFIGPVFGAQITDNELVRRQEWEADAREARSNQLFATCAGDDPQIAIGACTRQLLTRGNRSAFASGLPVREGGGELAKKARALFLDAVRYVLRANAYSSRGETARALRDYDRAVRSGVAAGVLVEDAIFGCMKGALKRITSRASTTKRSHPTMRRSN